MKTNWKALMIGGALLAGLSGTAAARDNVSFSLSFGVPGPVYVAPPAPVYYAPRYYAPPPVVYYEPAPVYYAQPAFGFTIRDGHRHRHGHRQHHHRGHWR